MKATSAQKLDIDIGKAGSVSELLDRPPKTRACFVFAHGAGAGMTHPFMETAAAGLGERGIATLRYQFPYMEKANNRPDPPAGAAPRGHERTSGCVCRLGCRDPALRRDEIRST